MRFHLARTFQRALDKLDNQSQGLVKQAALDFQFDPKRPSFKFHPVNNARDRGMWSFRVNKDIRVIVHHRNDRFSLCYVDHHDDAYKWAERHRVEEHPTTGALQLVEVVERQEIITKTVVREEEVVLPALATFEADFLLRLGVPTEWVDWIRTASQEAILEHISRLPEAVGLRILDLMTGGTATPPEPLPEHADPVDHPDAARSFVEVSRPETLRAALDAPWEEWLVFLHPDQRVLVDRTYKGPARVFGSAGTGKTVVALHRAAWLAQSAPERPILLTTFTAPLYRDLKRRFDTLVSADDPAHARVHVAPIHAVAAQLYQKASGRSFERVPRQRLANLIVEGLSKNPRARFTPEYVLSEWDAVIDPYFVRTRQEYFDAPRQGRGHGLDKVKKSRLWKVFSHILEAMDAQGVTTHRGLCGEVAEWLREDPSRQPFSHVVADEAQDLSHAELRFVRALAPEGPNDLFLVGDVAQRLYGRQCSWLRAGVDVRGNATILTVNYRTTEQIRQVSESLLPDTFENPDGEDEQRGARSIRQGLAPSIHPCDSEAEEIAALSSWLEGAREDGLQPHEIAVFVRLPEQLKAAKAAVQSAGLRWGMLQEDDCDDGQVRVGDMYTAKGLEFRAVAIMGCDDESLPSREALSRVADKGDAINVIEQERNLLYVASSRARDRLFISYTGQPSQFLSLLLSRPAPAEPESIAAPAPLPTEVVLPETEHVKPLPKTDFRLSPSRIANYFGLKCPRYLRYGAAWRSARQVADGVPPKPPESPLRQAILDSGLKWEEAVIAEHIPPERLIAPEGERPLSERSFTPAQTLAAIQAAQPGDYIYQATLETPDRFYDRFEVDKELVTFSRCRPDLLYIDADADGTRVLRVIDMKRGQTLRATYRVQLLMYALILEDILAEAGDGFEDIRVDVDTGAIWLGAHAKPTPCSLKAIRPHLYQLLRDELYDTLTCPPREVRWHVNYRCEWCPYLGKCWSEMEASDDVSQLPQLTHQGKAFLLEQGLSSVAAVHDVLENRPDEARAQLRQSASLAPQLHLLAPRAASLVTGTVQPQGASSMGLTIPTSKEVLVFLTLQNEALGRGKHLMGYHVEVGARVPEGVAYRRGSEQTAIILAGSPAQLPNTRRQFITELYGLVSRVDAFNLGRDWKEQLSLQFFLYSGAERALLIELLFEGLDEPETARAAATLLLYFQGPELMLADEHPADNIPQPLSVLLNILGRVLAVPVPVSYRLPETLKALGIDYPRDEDIHFPLSPTLRSELVYSAWYEGQADALARLRGHGRRYLHAISALLHALRERVKDELHLYTPKFQLPGFARFDEPLLSKMSFFARYESVLGCREVQQSRQIARRAVPFSESVLRLVSEGGNVFQLDEEDPIRLEAGGYDSWLLVRDTPEGRRAQLQFNDHRWRRLMFGGPSFRDLAICKIKAVESDALGAAQKLTLNIWTPMEGRAPAAGEAFLLYPRFADSLTDRTQAFLASLSEQPDSLFERMLKHPTSLAAPHPFSPDVEAVLDELAPGMSMTASKQAALTHLRSSRVLALWGPPGTGKTHFLSVTILALLEAHRRADKPFRVLVTAFTHAAVENVLRKLSEHARSPDSPLGEPLAAKKGTSWKGANRPRDIRVQPKSKIPDWIEQTPRCVLGGTAWAYDEHYGDITFDLVIIDEASQVKVPEASIAISMVNEGGRIIFAGDHLQLPPIVKGTYPEPEEPGAVALHRSIFEAVCDLEGGYFLRKLQENFRMNQALTEVSAQLLYGSDYVCGSDAIAAQRLPYTPVDSHSELVRTCLAPEFPMVVVLLKGLPPGKDNAPEAALVAELVFALREGLHRDGALYEDDALFFSKGVFIVSPHHSQIHRIRRELAADPGRHDWAAPPFVDTVEKMQGQESQAVVVSYGVSDGEFAQREANFIYNRNRLNVSITRGKAKTVVLMSEALLDAEPQVLEQREAEEGLGYMRALVELMRERGEASAFLLPDGVELEVLSFDTAIHPPIIIDVMAHARSSSLTKRPGAARSTG